MLQRFASAISVASPVVALATLIALRVPDLKPELVSRLTSFWCIVPSVWGLWALLAPRTWVPRRLPMWGAMLGVLVGVAAVFVLNLPEQILGFRPTALQHGLAVLSLAVFYYLLWMIVRAVFGGLEQSARGPR